MIIFRRKREIEHYQSFPMCFGYNLETDAYTLYSDIVGYFQILKSDTVGRILCLIHTESGLA